MRLEPGTRASTWVVWLALAAGSIAPARADVAAAGMDAYRRGDYATALTELTHLADRGHGPACVVVGRIYLDGKGVAKNTKTAAHYFERGANKGDGLAASYLGDLYATGKGLARDPAAALRYWRRAGHLGEPLAAHNLGIELWHGGEVPVDKKLALLWLDSALSHLKDSNEHLRADFTRDRDALAAELGTEGVAAAAELVSADGPTEGVVFRDPVLVHDRAVKLFPRTAGASSREWSRVFVALVLVRPTGYVSDSVIETPSDDARFDLAMMRLVRASPIVPKRRNDKPVASWQVLKWTVDLN